MKIEYRKPAGTGAWVILADEAETGSGIYARITGYQPSLSGSPQVTPMFLQGKVSVLDLGGGQWSLSFSIARQHGTDGAALLFLATHGLIFDSTTQLQAGLTGNIDLRVTVSGQIIFMLAAGVTAFQPDPHSDQSTFCRYSFVGGSYTTT